MQSKSSNFADRKSAGRKQKTGTRRTECGKLQPSEEGKGETDLENSIRKRVALEERAFRIVERLIENPVEEEYFRESGRYIDPNHYADIVEERSIVNQCGYPLCVQILKNVPKQKYRISTRTNTVYDITERKKFCSGSCYSASRYYEKQLSTVPVWARDEGHVRPPTLLTTETLLDGSGEQVTFHPAHHTQVELKHIEHVDRLDKGTKTEPETPNTGEMVVTQTDGRYKSGDGSCVVKGSGDCHSNIKVQYNDPKSPLWVDTDPECSVSSPAMPGAGSVPADREFQCVTTLTEGVLNLKVEDSCSEPPSSVTVTTANVGTNASVDKVVFVAGSCLNPPSSVEHVECDTPDGAVSSVTECRAETGAGHPRTVSESGYSASAIKPNGVMSTFQVQESDIRNSGVWSGKPDQGTQVCAAAVPTNHTNSSETKTGLVHYIDDVTATQGNVADNKLPRTSQCRKSVSAAAVRANIERLRKQKAGVGVVTSAEAHTVPLQNLSKDTDMNSHLKVKQKAPRPTAVELIRSVLSEWCTNETSSYLSANTTKGKVLPRNFQQRYGALCRSVDAQEREFDRLLGSELESGGELAGGLEVHTRYRCSDTGSGSRQYPDHRV